MFTVLGAGAWGTALAICVARNGHPTRLWGRDAERLDADGAARLNRRYLPHAPWPDALQVEPDLDTAIRGATELLLATPSGTFGSLLDAIARVPEPPPLLWACKGFERGSGRLLSDVVDERFGDGIDYGVLSGPTFAAEVASAQPTAITVATRTPAHGERISTQLHSESFRVYRTDDLVGVQVGGAVKNVLAIAVGISDGLGFGANARAALITRGLTEMMRLGVALGARRETLMGLAGLGDLVLTSTDDQSRNRRYGLALGAGASPEQAKTRLGALVEGAACALELRTRAPALGIELPIMAEVAAVVSGMRLPEDAVRRLMAREPKVESN